ncbi:MAG TPA: hypothetical protein DDZ68_13455 [Parvularcula sp.]|nr:hypothetical protein [Parvularcula sp.]HBS31589.1 hypothetical protein [Parvularcula sp.]HBS34167.1 hypothetical protein [Parvularcula sp.]
MASEPEKPSDDGKKERSRRPGLAGLFGFASAAAEEEALPAMDLAGGLDRALRRSGAQSKPVETPSPQADNNIREALVAIESALYSIDRVREIVEQAYEVALSAHEAEEPGARALLAESFDELRVSINTVIETVDGRAATLIGKNARQIDVKLGGKAHYSVSPFRLDASSKGLNVTPPRDAFATFEEVNAALDELEAALKKADRAANAYCRDAQFLIARLSSAAAAA